MVLLGNLSVVLRIHRGFLLGFLDQNMGNPGHTMGPVSGLLFLDQFDGIICSSDIDHAVDDTTTEYYMWPYSSQCSA